MENNNRILNEISVWNDNLKNLQGVFGNHVADYGYVIRAKLECFKQIKAKYKIHVNQDEKVAYKILQAEVKRLEKMAFPNRIERFVRKSVENARFVIQKVLNYAHSKQQVLTKNEFSQKEESAHLGNGETNLNKTAIQYNRKLKAVSDDTLLPKLRQRSGKGLKM